MQYKCNRYYIAFGKKFRNIWRAYDELIGTVHDVEPYIENATFENLQGLRVDPHRDYEVDLLKDLRSRFTNLNLLYSGGVDSHTIAVKAKQNNLQFDRTLVLKQFSEHHDHKIDTSHVIPYVTDFFKDDPGFEIVYNSKDWIRRVFKNKEWWYTGGDTDTAPIGQVAQLDVYDEDSVYVVGEEKPTILYSKGEWWITFPNTMINTCWSVPNCLFFYGLNEFCPEILIQHARKTRDFYVGKFGEPTETKWIHYKMFTGTPESDDFIRQFNTNLGRYTVPDNNHDVEQAHVPPAISHRGIARLNDLCQTGDMDLAMQLLKDCNALYHKHPQIQWEFPPFEIKGRTPWFVNLDSLEFLPGDQIGAIT